MYPKFTERAFDSFVSFLHMLIAAYAWIVLFSTALIFSHVAELLIQTPYIQLTFHHKIFVEIVGAQIQRHRYKTPPHVNKDNTP